MMSGSTQTAGRRSTRDRISTVLLLIAASGALFGFFAAIPGTREAGGDSQLVEMWRMWGLLAFSGIFLLLAVRPRGLPGIWEVVFFHKAAVAATAFFMRSSDSDSAGEVALIDGMLAVLIAVAYVLSRGYASWRGSK